MTKPHPSDTVASTARADTPPSSVLAAENQDQELEQDEMEEEELDEDEVEGEGYGKPLSFSSVHRVAGRAWQASGKQSRAPPADVHVHVLTLPHLRRRACRHPDPSISPNREQLFSQHHNINSHLDKLVLRPSRSRDFIEDDFNLTGLSALVPFYKEAMEMVLDVEAEEEAHRVPDVTIVESSAELLYGLIHQRFIITRQGLQQMVTAVPTALFRPSLLTLIHQRLQYAKYDATHFGTCPRVYCTSGKLVPCGRSDLPGVDTVKLYCPSCVDMYVPPSSRFLGVD
ncbi:casein kinase II subunit beta, partial [Phenoliferia sp. Uapishka_3]